MTTQGTAVQLFYDFHKKQQNNNKTQNNKYGFLTLW